MVTSAIAIGFAKFTMKLNEDEKKAFAFIATIVEPSMDTPEALFHKFNVLAPINRNLFLTVVNSINHGQLVINPEESGLSVLGITPLFAEVIDFMSEDSNKSFIEEAVKYVTLIKRGYEND